MIKPNLYKLLSQFSSRPPDPNDHRAGQFDKHQAAEFAAFDARSDMPMRDERGQFYGHAPHHAPTPQPVAAPVASSTERDEQDAPAAPYPWMAPLRQQWAQEWGEDNMRPLNKFLNNPKTRQLGNQAYQAYQAAQSGDERAGLENLRPVVTNPAYHKMAPLEFNYEPVSDAAGNTQWHIYGMGRDQNPYDFTVPQGQMSRIIEENILPMAAAKSFMEDQARVAPQNAVSQNVARQNATAHYGQDLQMGGFAPNGNQTPNAYAAAQPAASHHMPTHSISDNSAYPIQMQPMPTQPISMLAQQAFNAPLANGVPQHMQGIAAALTPNNQHMNTLNANNAPMRDASMHGADTATVNRANMASQANIGDHAGAGGSQAKQLYRKGLRNPTQPSLREELRAHYMSEAQNGAHNEGQHPLEGRMHMAGLGLLGRGATFGLGGGAAMGTGLGLGNVSLDDIGRSVQNRINTASAAAQLLGTALGTTWQVMANPDQARADYEARLAQAQQLEAAQKATPPLTPQDVDDYRFSLSEAERTAFDERVNRNVEQIIASSTPPEPYDDWVKRNIDPITGGTQGQDKTQTQPLTASEIYAQRLREAVLQTPNSQRQKMEDEIKLHGGALITPMPDVPGPDYLITYAPTGQDFPAMGGFQEFDGERVFVLDMTAVDPDELGLFDIEGFSADLSDQLGATIYMQVKNGDHKYGKRPEAKDIVGFGTVRRSTRRTKRPRYDATENARYLEWDGMHREVEAYDGQGRHLGAYDPYTHKQTKEANSGRRLRDI